ncbi:MAG: hypothetical protein ACOC6G_04185 [Thermoproteota archaeon]
MSRIDLIIVPDLYTSYRQLTTYLEQEDYTDFFLSQPMHLEDYLLDLTQGMGYREFINRIRSQKLIPEPVNSWRYPLEPLLTSLPALKNEQEDLTLHCYISSSYHRLRMAKASELALLTLRSNITQKIDVQAWKTTIQEWLNQKPKELPKEVDFIDQKAGEKPVCVVSSNGRILQNLLKEKGHTVTRKKVEQCYHPKPLRILEDRLKKEGEISQEEIKELIKEQLEYIQDYVFKYQNLDQAHWKWSWDKFSDVRGRYDPQDIEMLGHIRLMEL